MYLGVKGVIAKSFARIHKANLINFGIIPFEFQSASDFELLTQGKHVKIEDVKSNLKQGNKTMEAKAGVEKIMVKVDLTERQRDIMIAGGLLNYIKSTQHGS